MSMSWSEWWLYAVLTLSAFIGFLILHYIVKVINDAKLEDRYLRIRQKASANQATQVHCPLAEITARIPLDNMLDTHTTPNKISLVFNKHNNIHKNKKIEDVLDSENETPVKGLSTTTFGAKSCESIVKPILLGNIYNKNNSDTIDERIASNKEEIDNTSENKNETESKSIKFRTQNYQDVKEWIDGLLKKIPIDDSQ